MPAECLAADEAGIARAATLLREGKLVAFGTETVYGLGADATNEDAVSAIFAAKGRPSFNPLICHYASAEAAFADVVANDLALRLADKFWPGPLTLVLPRLPSSRVVQAAAAGLPTLAVRVPAHPIARQLLASVRLPIAAPSANRSGRVSPTTPAHVLADLEDAIAAILESGPTSIGVESTVIDLSSPEPRLLRPGGLAIEAIGPLAAPPPDHPPTAPGMLASHYAPSLPLRLVATRVSPDEALLAFGRPLPGAHTTFQLSFSENLAEAAQRLFAGLRTLDEEGIRLGLRGIAAMPIPARDLGLAITDRLRRASAGGRARPGALPLDPAKGGALGTHSFARQRG
ncbi:MAG TPA: L-threonylcarbamoyladenylate synthase [Acetobacteraceae bacterium]|nr:L-threonylcarbamoyladenylate synthase [Acetobacteraceae bacterium]